MEDSFLFQNLIFQVLKMHHNRICKIMNQAETELVFIGIPLMKICMFQICLCRILLFQTKRNGHKLKFVNSEHLKKHAEFFQKFSACFFIFLQIKIILKQQSALRLFFQFAGGLFEFCCRRFCKGKAVRSFAACAYI